MRYTLLIIILLLVSMVGNAKVSAIIEQWETRLRVPVAHELSITEFIRVKVLEEDGYVHAIYHDYYDAFRKIRSIKYTIYDATGKKIKRLTKADAVDVMLNPMYEVNDARMVVIDPEYRNFPFVVEIEVEISYNGFISFPLWIPRSHHNLEVKNAMLELQCFKDFAYRSREVNGMPSPVITEGPDNVTSRWTVEGLNAVEKHELGHDSFLSDQPKLHIAPINFSVDKRAGSFRSWEEFGDWYYELNEGRNQLSPQTKLFLDDLMSKNKGDIGTVVKTVYQAMQSKTRYISIQLGIGGFQAIPSDVVEKSGYGDCKALTNYMKAMLDYLQIPSNLVLVRAGSQEQDILADFPSSQFNHVFLAVPSASDTIWFESTSQTRPPGFLGTFTDDRHVLWIEKGASKIVRTPVLSSDESVMRRKARIVFKPNGDAELTVNVEETGMFYEEAAIFQGSSKERLKEYNNNKFSYRDFSITQFEYKVPNPNEPLLFLKYSLRLPGFAKVVGNKLILPVNVLTPAGDDFVLDQLLKKCEIRRAFTIIDEVDVSLPENYRIDFVPVSVNQKSPFADFSLDFTSNEAQLQITRKVKFQKGIYRNQSFDSFNDAIRKIKSADQSKIVAVSKT
jgi:hypothetical protein